MTNKKHIVVVGGGISGLAAAHRVLAIARERSALIELTLLEKSARLGGIIETRKHGAATMELGPDSLFTEKPWGLDLCQRMGLEPELIRTQPSSRRSAIWLNNKLHPVPKGFYLLAPSRFLPFAFSSLLSVRGKIRALIEPWVRANPSAEDESLASFVRRRLGQEMLERMAQPMVSGIYCADPEKLSLQATFPRFLQLEKEHGSILRGLMFKNQATPAENLASGPRYSLFVSFKDGMETLIKKLEAQMPVDSIRLGTETFSIERADRKWRLQHSQGEILADGVILAIPAYVAGALLAKVAPDLAQGLNSIPYHSSATVNLLYKNNDLKRPLMGAGFVVPAIAGKCLIGCSFSSNKYAGRALPGYTLLRVFLGGEWLSSRWSLSDSELSQKVQEDLCLMLGVQANPADQLIARYPGSLPQYELGHLAKVAKIESQLQSYPGLALAGNAYRSTGIPDCIHSGELAAQKVGE